MNRNKRKTRARLLNTALCLVPLLVVCYFILLPERNVFNSDYADTLSWAVASVDAGALFSHDFTYACLLPFGGQLLMMPFVALFGFSYTAHAIGMILFFFALATAVSALFRALGANPFFAAATLFCVFGTLCSAEKLREIYFGHILYYSLGGLFLVVGLFLVLTLDRDKGKKFPLRTAFFCLWCVLCSTDGLTSLTLFVLPLCAALAFERLCDRNVSFFSAENYRLSRPLLLSVCFSLAGFGLGFFLRHNYTAGYQTAYSTFSENANWAENLAQFFPSFLELFTGSVELYEPFTSFAGITAALRLLFALLLLAAPLVALFFYKSFCRGEKLLLISHFAVSATMLFAFVFGLLSSAAWRLTPMVFTSLLVLLMLTRHLCVRSFWRRFGVLLLAFCLLIAGLGFYGTLSLPTAAKEGSANDLANHLKASGYTYGYTTFWNANAITALSEDAVKCRSVELSEDGGYLSPSDYQSEHSWYSGQGENETYFLLLSENEYLAVNKEQLGNPIALDRYNGFVIVTLSADLFPLY